ncbi:acyl carrier protein [Natranaerovirga pectinivora]|uniref:acyl carrier protein n=1 Tax=Natranaerovirga pectinivora TaxID=682400 RepID=UPI003FA5A094
MFEKVKEIIVKELGVDESEVTLEASFQEDLGADSLDLFELVMSFEEEFGVEIPNEDLEGIKTVNNCVEYIKAKQ